MKNKKLSKIAKTRSRNSLGQFVSSCNLMPKSRSPERSPRSSERRSPQARRRTKSRSPSENRPRRKRTAESA